MCRGHLPFSSRLGPAAIGLMFAGLLLLSLMLLFCFLFECGSHNFKNIPMSLQDEGNQTLVKYNEEGGGSNYKFEPFPRGGGWITPSTAYNVQHNFQGMSSGGGVMSMPHHNGSMVRSFRNQSRQMSRSHSLARTEINLGEHIERKISGFPEEQRDYPEYSLHQYEYEGRDTDRQSLDQLTVSNFGENLDFLQNLGPKFNTLGGICQQSMEPKNVRL